jgi:hypothetical protein
VRQCVAHLLQAVAHSEDLLLVNDSTNRYFPAFEIGLNDPNLTTHRLPLTIEPKPPTIERLCSRSTPHSQHNLFGTVKFDNRSMYLQRRPHARKSLSELADAPETSLSHERESRCDFGGQIDNEGKFRKRTLHSNILYANSFSGSCLIVPVPPLTISPAMRL